MRQTKLMSVFLGLILSSIPFATFAVDAVAKEETTPPNPAGALSANQIQPIDSAKLIKQAAPAPQPAQSAAPAEANPNAVQVQPAAPSAPMQQPMQTAPDSTAIAPNAPGIPPQPNQPPVATQMAPVSPNAPQQAQPNNAPNAMPAQ